MQHIKLILSQTFLISFSDSSLAAEDPIPGSSENKDNRNHLKHFSSLGDFNKFSGKFVPKYLLLTGFMTILYGTL